MAEKCLRAIDFQRGLPEFEVGTGSEHSYVEMWQPVPQLQLSIPSPEAQQRRWGEGSCAGWCGGAVERERESSREAGSVFSRFCSLLHAPP